MYSLNRTGQQHLIRVVCPDGHEIEADHDGYTDFLRGIAQARRLAMELASEEPDLGRNEVAADLLDTLRVMGVDPLACEVVLAVPALPDDPLPSLLGGRVAVYACVVADFIPAGV